MKKILASLVLAGFTFTSFAYTINEVKARAHAICKDGTTSYSVNRRGTCSHHGGVSSWLY